MPNLDRDARADGPAITGFAGNGFRVDGIAVHEGGLLMTPESAIGWDAPAIDALTPDIIAPLLEQVEQPEFLLLGTGARLVRPSAAFVSALEAKGIGVEAMDSRTAARAWGLLRGEGRMIVAALLPLNG